MIQKLPFQNLKLCNQEKHRLQQKDWRQLPVKNLQKGIQLYDFNVGRKKNQNKHSKFDTKFVIRRTVKMT